MHSQVHEINPVTVEVEVEIPWDRVQRGLDASYGKLQKTAKVRGFRPGKVPRNVLKQLYGPQVRSDVVSALVEEGLLEAVQSHEIAIVASPKVSDLSEIQHGLPYAFKATVEVRPKIASIELAGLSIERAASEVSETEVDAELERMRDRQAEIVTPDPMRPAREGDLLTIDYVVEVDAEERPDLAAKTRVVELVNGKLIPEFEEGLLGKQPGDDVQIRIAYGDDVQNDALKNRRALFRISVKELREKVLPDLDDEFAQEQGDHETLAQLRDSVRARLSDAARKRSDSQLRERVLEKLVALNPVPVPPSLVAQQVKSMRQEMVYILKMTGSSGEDLPDELVAGMIPRAEQKVRAAILLGELARQQAIGVEQAEVEARLATIAEQTGKHIAKVRVEYAGERREALEGTILEDKLLDYLLTQATVIDKPSAASGASDEG